MTDWHSLPGEGSWTYSSLSRQMAASEDNKGFDCESGISQTEAGESTRKSPRQWESSADSESGTSLLAMASAPQMANVPGWGPFRFLGTARHDLLLNLLSLTSVNVNQSVLSYITISALSMERLGTKIQMLLFPHQDGCSPTKISFARTQAGSANRRYARITPRHTQTAAPTTFHHRRGR